MNGDLGRIPNSWGVPASQLSGVETEVDPGVLKFLGVPCICCLVGAGVVAALAGKWRGGGGSWTLRPLI